MSTSNALAHVGLLTFSATVTTALAVYAFRHRQEPGARWFGMLMVSLTIWSGGYAIAISTFDPGWRLFVERIQWFGVATLYVWLFLFALSYTGHDQLVTRKAVAGFCLVPALVFEWGASSRKALTTWSRSAPANKGTCRRTGRAPITSARR